MENDRSLKERVEYFARGGKCKKISDSGSVDVEELEIEHEEAIQKLLTSYSMLQEVVMVCKLFVLYDQVQVILVSLSRYLVWIWRTMFRFSSIMVVGRTGSFYN